MLNNILIMIDNREKRLAQEELENIELQKKRFNNKFELYKGQDLKYNTIINLLKSAKYNMKDYKVENGKIEILTHISSPRLACCRKLNKPYLLSIV